MLQREHPDSASEAGVLESVAAIGAGLRASGHQVSELGVGSCVNELIRRLADLQPDVVVNLCESFAGCSAGESYLPALLELLKISYSGSTAECLALARDKPRTKRLLAGAGLTTPEFIEVTSQQALPETFLQQWIKEFPLILKPANEDASLGIGQESVITTWESLLKQVAMIRERYGAVLIERYIDGREFNVGIVELPDLQVLPIAEIEFRIGPALPWPIVTYAGKWATESDQDLSTPVVCPAALEPDLKAQIEADAIEAYRLTGCRDYARIDLRVDRRRHAYILEVNPNPDLGPQAGLARMLQAAGIKYGEFAERLVDMVGGRRNVQCRERKVDKSTDSGHSTVIVQKSKDRTQIGISRYVPENRQAVLELTRSCGVFRPDEVQIADEVLGSAERDGPAGDYQVLVAEAMGRTVGWSCYGRVPLTDATFDLYWIAVAPDMQGRGIGKRLLDEVEQKIRGAGGRWLLAETSSTADYRATHAFYERCGFREVNRIEDFYRAGDGRITFGKRLDRA